MTSNELYSIILDRKRNPQPGSYTARLFEQGRDEIIKKVGEEAVEVLLAAAVQGRQRLVEEIADLAYHTLVLMAANEITPDDISAELAHRHR